jgi:2-phosphoglycerate kinase
MTQKEAAMKIEDAQRAQKLIDHLKRVRTVQDYLTRNKKYALAKSIELEAIVLPRDLPTSATSGN